MEIMINLNCFDNLYDLNLIVIYFTFGLIEWNN